MSDEINDENFRSAASSLKENEAMWAHQIHLTIGHPVTLDLDFESLGNRYELVQPFIHQGLAAVIAAFPLLMGDSATWGDFVGRIRHVSIGALKSDEACRATLEGDALDVRVPLQTQDVMPPTRLVVDAFRAVLGLPAASPPVVGTEEFGTPEPAREQGGFVPSPYAGDPYAYGAQFILDLEAVMRANDLWPGPKPPGEIEVKGAFGSENMAFNQWLAWVLIPRVAAIVETRDSFPSDSSVAAYAVREWDGLDAWDVIGVLQAFDDVVSGLWS